MNARKLQKQLNYIDWRNFNNLILRAENLIKNGIENGLITKTICTVKLGSGSLRNIPDYYMDERAQILIKKLALSYKLNKSYLIRNETSILSLLQKYCIYKNIDYEFQFKLDKYIYDFKYEKTLIEFDEPHHKETRQSFIDEEKNINAKNNGFKIVRIGLHKDIIDLIIMLG